MKRMLALAFALLPPLSALAAEPPTLAALQEEFLRWRFGMFIHFNMATFNDRQWATGTEDPATFAPTRLDCGQWLDAAAGAGMKYAVLTVKHTGGWCLWDSKHTDAHDIRSFRNFRNGQGDLVREFVEACRKRGIKVGLYYCMPGDFAKRHLPKGEEDKLHGLPPEAQGRYTAFIKLQLGELLTQYGPIDLMWFDQYSNRYTGDDWRQIKAQVKSLQPGCVVIANNSLNFSDTDIHSYEYPFLKAKGRPQTLPPEGNPHAAEVCDTLGLGWFWTSRENESAMKSVDQVADMLELCRKRRANYLLNVGPDNTGRLPDYVVKRLHEIGVRLIASWPGTIPAGVSNDALLMTMDLLPTFAQVAGARLPADRVMDGRDQMPILIEQGKAPEPP